MKTKTPQIWQERFDWDWQLAMEDLAFGEGRAKSMIRDFISQEIAKAREGERERIKNIIQEFKESFNETTERDIYPMKEIRDATFNTILQLLTPSNNKK